MNVLGQLTDTGNKDFNSFNYVGVAVRRGTRGAAQRQIHRSLREVSECYTPPSPTVATKPMVVVYKFPPAKSVYKPLAALVMTGIL